MHPQKTARLTLVRLGCTLPLLGIVAAGCDPPVDACAKGEPGTICTIAGTGELAFKGDGLPADRSALYLPSQVRRGPDGLLYIMDFNNHRIRRIQADGTLSTIAGDGFHAGAIPGVPATASSLENPIDFDFLADGRLVFVSYHDPRILLIDYDGTIRVLAGGEPGIRGNEGDGGPAVDARFLELVGIAVGDDDVIYVADRAANRVRVISDGIIDTLAGTGGPGYRGDGGPARDAALDKPSALATDAAGNLFIADSGNSVVRKVSTDGVISTIAGVSRHGFAGDGGRAIDAMLAGPDGLAVAVDGTLFIGDRLNHRVRKVSPDGTITTIGGTGVKGYAGDGGPALDAQLGYVSRIQVDDDGALLIADQTNSTIRKILPPL